jgi:hypothetical protein
MYGWLLPYTLRVRGLEPSRGSTRSRLLSSTTSTLDLAPSSCFTAATRHTATRSEDCQFALRVIAFYSSPHGGVFRTARNLNGTTSGSAFHLDPLGIGAAVASSRLTAVRCGCGSLT